MTRTLYTAVAALLFSTTHISAHCVFAAEYNENKQVTVSGTVIDFKWTNPQAWLYVEGKREGGKV